MKAFVKTESKEMVSINGYEREVDWACDAINHAIINVAIRDAEIREQKLSVEAIAARTDSLRKNYCEGINRILADDNASEIIFAEDDSLEFVSEVYEYLAEGYTEYRKRKTKKYSPERIADEPNN